MTESVFRNVVPLIGLGFDSAPKTRKPQGLGGWGQEALLNHPLVPWTRPSTPDHNSGAKLRHNLTGVNFVTIRTYFGIDCLALAEYF
jgi:hypothetical protein